jgi:hypothetical protein
MLDLDGHFDLGLIKRESRLSVRLNSLQFIIALVPISTPARQQQPRSLLTEAIRGGGGKR